MRTIGSRAPEARGRLLDLGCGHRPYRSLFTGVDEYVGLDVSQAGASPDVLGLGWALPFREATFDAVFTAQVLEHVEEPGRVLHEISRVLRPAGLLLVTAPQAWRAHEVPHDFFRYTSYGLAHLAHDAGLEVLEIVPHGGVWTSVATMINGAVASSVVPRRLAPLWYLANNGLFGLLDAVWRDEADTSNHLLVARKAAASP